MPSWYWSELSCRRHYIAHIRAALEWQQQERGINERNAEFFRKLTLPGTAGAKPLSGAHNPRNQRIPEPPISSDVPAAKKRTAPAATAKPDDLPPKHCYGEQKIC